MRIFRLAIVVLLGIGVYPISFLLLGKTFGEIVFYRGLVHAFLVFAIQVLIGICILRGVKIFANAEQISLRVFISVSLAALALSFNITFLIVFPVTFDRSVTTYLLEEIAHKKSLSIEDMQTLLIYDYVVKNEAVERRMREQELSGNVTSQDGRYALTAQGEKFISVSREVRRLFSIPPHSEARISETQDVEK